MNMNMNSLIFKYCFFAILAILVNLYVQRLILNVEKYFFSLFFAIFLGTLAGLLLKFALDKYFIFYNYEKKIKNNSKMFFKYTFMGIFTTIVFWTIESVFWLIWKTEMMREFGAIIGLSIGYILKYRLDRKYVFKTNI